MVFLLTRCITLSFSAWGITCSWGSSTQMWFHAPWASDVRWWLEITQGEVPALLKRPKPVAESSSDTRFNSKAHKTKLIRPRMKVLHIFPSLKVLILKSNIGHRLKDFHFMWALCVMWVQIVQSKWKTLKHSNGAELAREMTLPHPVTLSRHNGPHRREEGRGQKKGIRVQ